MIKAFLFDMGGTLEDVEHRPEDNQSCGRVMLDYLASQGIRIDMEPEQFTLHLEKRNQEYRAWGMESLRELDPFSIWGDWYLKGLIMDEDSQRLRVVADNAANLWERNYYRRTLRPDAAQLLKGLQERGFAMGVISNTGCQSQVIEILHEYGLREYFGAVYLSSLSGLRKPHPLLFLSAAADLGALPEECVYVGDTVSRDVRGARAAGFGATVRIGSHLTARSDANYVTQGEEADHLVSRLAQILDLEIAAGSVCVGA